MCDIGGTDLQGFGPFDFVLKIEWGDVRALPRAFRALLRAFRALPRALLIAVKGVSML